MGDAVYRPQNILLTGGAGFIGSHVATLLCTRYPEYKVRPPPRLDAKRAPLTRARGAQVVVLDKLDYSASLRNLEAASALPNFKARACAPFPRAFCAR